MTVYLSAMMRPLVPIVDYLVHFDYVVEKLCKNKDKPFLKCYGSCYVSEKMASDNYLDFNKHKKNSENSKVEVFAPVFLIESTLQFSIEYIFNSELLKPTHFDLLKKICYLNNVFKPPRM